VITLTLVSEELLKVSALKFTAVLLLVTGSYWLLGLIGLGWAVTPGAGSSVWPAAGVGVAALLIGGVRLWPCIFVGRLLVALTDGTPQPFWLDLTVSGGNAIATYLGVWLCRRGWSALSEAWDLRGIVRLIVLAAGVSSTVAAAIGVSALVVAGRVAPSLAGSAFEGWAIGNFVGVLTTAGVILAWWGAKPDEYTRSQRLHLAVVLAAVAGLSAVVFLTPGTLHLRTWLVFPPMVWAAIAFHVRGATAALALTSTAAVAGSALSLGPFSLGAATPFERAQLLQQFLAGAYITVLLLAALARERSKQEAERLAQARAQAVSERLRESEARLRLAQRAARAVTWEHDVGAGITLWSDVEAARDMAGAHLEEQTPLRDWVKLLHPDDREAYFAQWQEAMGRGDGAVSFRIMRGAETRWIEVFGRVTARDSQGQPTKLAGISLDITNRKEAELALQASERRLRLAIDAGRMAVWELDVTKGVVASSPELNRLFGYPPAMQPTLEELRSRYYPGERDRLMATAAEAVRRGENFIEGEYRFYRLDGELRWFLLRAEILLAPDGSPRRVMGVLLDITDRKQAELALQEREGELKAALDAGSLAIVDFDHRTGLFKPSRRLAELFGYPPERVLTVDDLRSRYHPDDVQKVLELSASTMADPAVSRFQWTLRLVLPDGSIRWIDARGEYVRDQDGAVVRSRGVMLDITERKRWEEHQRLLINELNHRVKNTLAVVQSLVRQTLRAGSPPETARAALEARLSALAAAHNLITEQNWEWAALDGIVETSVRASVDAEDPRVTWRGPDVRLPPQNAVSVALALHELCTNALKYGALTTLDGRVEVNWRRYSGPRGEDRLCLEWREQCGPPVTPPAKPGFGTRLIESGLAGELGATARLHFNPDGLMCTIDWPLTRAAPLEAEKAIELA
jgi:PAS domain S-box-containing protein